MFHVERTSVFFAFLRVRFAVYSRALLSIQMVTGPSFVRDTCMSGAEATRADGATESLLKSTDNLAVEGLGDLGAGGTDVGWAVTFLRLRHESELRYGDDVPADIEDTAVHHPVFVVEDTQLCGLLHEVLDVLCGVVGGDADEDEHAEAVALGDSYSVDVDGCGAGALDEEAHGYEWVILRGGRRCG